LREEAKKRRGKEYKAGGGDKRLRGWKCIQSHEGRERNEREMGDEVGKRTRKEKKRVSKNLRKRPVEFSHQRRGKKKE